MHRSEPDTTEELNHMVLPRGTLWEVNGGIWCPGMFFSCVVCPWCWLADYSRVIEFKEKRLASEKPRCQLERVKLDLANVSERRQMFATINARAKKVLVLTEGIVPYLSIEEVGSLARSSTNNRRLIRG
jgi:hypothetical protein